MHDSGDHERLLLTLEATGLDLWENDLVSGEITRKVAKVFAELGYEPEESVAYVDDIFSIVHPDDVSCLKGAVAAHIRGDTPQYRCEFRLRSKAGSWVWYANYGKIMDRDAVNPGRRFIGVTFNIDDRKRREAELELANSRLVEQNGQLAAMNAVLQSLAATDPLTGLANRRRLLEVGEQEVLRALRMEHALSLLIVDIDDFKNVNDTWGHATGDLVICAVSEACTRSVRSLVDVVGRIGGEEFAVVLPETCLYDATALAERLRQAVAASPVALGAGATFSPTVSIGVASLSPDLRSMRDLLIHADKALYLAKGAGKNCVRLHTA